MLIVIGDTRALSILKLDSCYRCLRITNGGSPGARTSSPTNRRKGHKAKRWQQGGRAFFLSAILLLPLRLSDTQTGSKTLFLLATLSPRHPRYSLSAKRMKLQKLWDIEKEETGASLIGTKKLLNVCLSYRGRPLRISLF